MDKEFVNPNLHVALVHYPLALLVAGTLIEVFSFLWRRHGFRTAGRWMILLGALTAVPTVTSGIYALYDVANPNNETVLWSQIVAQNNLHSAQWEMLTDHLRLEIISTFLALLEVFGRNGLPLSLYTDRCSHFYTVEAGGKVDRGQPAQVGRALAHLGVEHIPRIHPRRRSAQVR